MCDFFPSRFRSSLGDGGVYPHQNFIHFSKTFLMDCYFPPAISMLDLLLPSPAPQHTRRGNKNWTRQYTQGQGLTCVCRVALMWAVRVPGS